MVKYHPMPQPDEISGREKEDAMGAYLMMFASVAIGLPLPIINLVAAIVYYYVNRSDSKFVNYHALHSLYAQIPTSILNGIAVIWVARTFILFDATFDQYLKGYLVMVAAANLLYFIFSIIAAMKARKGYFYYFVFFGKLAYHQVFQVREDKEKGVINKPPTI